MNRLLLILISKLYIVNILICFNRKKSNTLEPIQTLVSTPSHISQVQKLKELESTIDEIIKQLNNHLNLKSKQMKNV